MNIRIRLIIAVGVICMLAAIVNIVKKKNVELKYVLVWLVLGGIILLLVCFPALMTYLSDLLGIANPMNMLFFFGFCFLLIIVFGQTILISRQSIRIKELAQYIAINKKTIE